MRVFIGLKLSDPMKRGLLKAKKAIDDTGAGISWVSNENLHITIKFLGDIYESFIPNLSDMLSDVAINQSSFDIELGQLGAFPSIDLPRVIWAGVSKNNDKVVSLAKEVFNGCSVIGIPNDNLPFTAHITIGRVRYPKDKKVLAQTINSFKPEKLSSVVNSLILYKSELTEEGPFYTELAKFKFQK